MTPTTLGSAASDHLATSSEVSKGGSSRFWLIVAGGVAVVVVSGWWGSRSDADDRSEALTSQTPESQTIENQPTVNEPVEGVSSSNGPPVPQADPSDGDEVMIESDDGSETFEVRLTDINGQPASDEVLASIDSSLLLIVSSEATLIDFQSASGSSVLLSKSVARMQNVELISDTHVVFRTGAGGRQTIPLADLSSEPIRLPSEIGQVFGAATPGFVWASGDDTAPDFLLVDLATGQLVSSRPLPVTALPLPAAGGLVNVMGRGVFEVEGDTATYLFPGFAMAASDDLVLVEFCDDDLRCANIWYDRASGERLGYPSIKQELNLWIRTVIDPSGRWVVLGTEAGGLALFEIETGQEIDLDLETYYPFSFSQDGDWLVEGGFEGIVLVHIETEQRYRLDLPQSASDPLGLSFVDPSAVG